MKQYPFIISVAVLSFAATGIDAKLPRQNISTMQMIDVYVRRDENILPNRVEPLMFVGTFNLVTSVVGQDVIIQVDDQRTNTPVDTRRGRTESDGLLTANLLCPIQSEITIQ